MRTNPCGPNNLTILDLGHAEPVISVVGTEGFQAERRTVALRAMVTLWRRGRIRTGGLHVMNLTIRLRFRSTNNGDSAIGSDYEHNRHLNDAGTPARIVAVRPEHRSISPHRLTA